MAYTPVINWGSTDQAEVVLSGEFNGETNASEMVALAAGEAVDSLAVLQWETAGLATGPYDFTLTVAGELGDDDATNNSAVAGIEMTEYIMARDDDLIRGQTPGGGDNQGVGFATGCTYEIFGDAVVYAIDFALTNNSVAGEEMFIQLFDASGEDFELLSESDEVVIDASNYNDFSGGEVTWVTVTLDTPIEVTAGDFILPTVFYEGGAGVQVAEAQSDTQDQTAFIFGDFGTAGVDWYFTNDLPMVRLNFNPGAETTIGEVDAKNFALGQNVPNPVSGVTSIDYSLTQNASVSFEVLDLTGKHIFSSNEGRKAAGSYAVSFDASELAAGMYSYSLVVNGEKLTKRMIVR
jgi:hypothetical protein